jgi:hypothetical protein
MIHVLARNVLFEGACPELVEGACPELVEGKTDRGLV